MRTVALVALLVAIVYAVVAGLIAAFQGRLIYPSAGQGPTLAPDAWSALGMAPLADAERQQPGRQQAVPRALVAEPEGAARATAVVFHGNAGTALDRGYYVDALTRRGLRVVLAEYPGYGGRPGSPSEDRLAADAAETLRQVAAQFPGPLVVWGESLGAGVAAAAVARTGDLADAVVLVTPWDSLLKTASGAYPWLPVALLLRDRYDSVANLSAFDGPVAVVVAGQDEVIPAPRGRALFEALDQPKQLWTFDQAGHNSWPIHSRAAWWTEVLAFALAAPAGDAAPA